MPAKKLPKYRPYSTVGIAPACIKVQKNYGSKPGVMLSEPWLSIMTPDEIQWMKDKVTENEDLMMQLLTNVLARNNIPNN